MRTIYVVGQGTIDGDLASLAAGKEVAAGTALGDDTPEVLLGLGAGARGGDAREANPHQGAGAGAAGDAQQAEHM